MVDRIDLQNAEFAAVSRLVSHYRKVTLTPPVDDNYPQVRRDYDRALADLIKKVRKNRGESWPT